jgi:hypothetical protein
LLFNMRNATKILTITRHYAAFIDIDDVFRFNLAIILQHIKVLIDSFGRESFESDRFLDSNTFWF